LAADNDNPREPARTRRCPNCNKPAVSDYLPFCSGRCKDLDLARWLRGSYAIPVGNDDEDEDGDDANIEIEKLNSAITRNNDPN